MQDDIGEMKSRRVLSPNGVVDKERQDDYGPIEVSKSPRVLVCPPKIRDQTLTDQAGILNVSILQYQEPIVPDEVVLESVDIKSHAQ